MWEAFALWFSALALALVLGGFVGALIFVTGSVFGVIVFILLSMAQKQEKRK